ncbi:MAG: hypothetical protein II298_05370 [Bacteroidales bacterium]|jgi:hypothetical protein|nr:hypothetical protein [Bacteroidales bacterium]
MLSRDEIIKQINEHLEKSGKRYYSEFYIGVSQDAVKRLFEEHHVDKENSWWIYTTAKSSEEAREVEKHYLDLGMRGGTGGGDNKSKMVYCYVVTPTTTE